MYNQNWRVATGPTQTPADVSPDTQVTDAWEIVFRMDDRAYSSPGPEIVVSVYGEHCDVNDGDSDIVITAQIAYEIREENGDVYDSDYEYHTEDGRTFPDATTADWAAHAMALEWAARGDDGWDWNGKSGMMRKGGEV
jgi:hypothetical protein